MSNESNTETEEAEVDDATLIQQAEAEAAEERLLNAAKLLRKVKDKEVLTKKHRTILRWSVTVKDSMKALLESPDAEGSAWTKQSESHGDRDFFVYYQVEPETNKLFCRIESSIESSLLVPLLSVFNESSLYQEWMPSWKKPFKLGVQESNTLAEYGRGNQIIQVKVAMPFFFATREVMMHAVAVDVIEEEGVIAIQVKSETTQDDSVIPEPKKGEVRIDFESSILVQGCPEDHPLYPKSEEQRSKLPEGDEIIHIGMRMTVNSHVHGVPMSFINFATRTVIGTMWGQLLRVAESVRDGEMSLHREKIKEKAELYDWIKERMDAMVAKVKEEQKTKE
mmetsp:Transcript_46076/g.111606  ORF Transcript_46076/g.111606 Transcript_46076/m.111606 type:complete len:337 (+) Transcript_46076:56-1066(+)